MSKDPNSSERKDNGSPPGAIREFIVEFLGSLVPGVAFLFAFVPAFVIPISTIALTFLPHPTIALPTFQGAVPTSVSTVMFLLFPALVGFFVFAYIAGHLFYRQNPKTADEASFKRICKGDEAGKTNDRMVRETVETAFRKDGTKYEKHVTHVEFPYHFLREYLVDRGINYLAARVPWDHKEHKRRAKHFANALKLRIQTASAEGSAILARNEAHIRLSSSMWFVCRTLNWASFAGLFAFCSVAAISHWYDWTTKLDFSVMILFPSLTLLLGLFTKYAIERALHYQREREILFILELAHWLVITDRSPKMFDGLGNGPSASDQLVPTTESTIQVTRSNEQDQILGI